MTVDSTITAGTIADLPQLPCDRILSDEEFNCRGYIPPSDVVDLAKDIEHQGLIQPITVQPWKKVSGFDWRIVTGHRRHTAIHKVLKWPTIPCIIREGLSDTDALIMNFTENLQRKELDMVQEARALKRLKDAGIDQVAAAKTLKVTRPWVQVRYYLLDMPEDIQAEVRAGYITQAHIHQLHDMPLDEMYEAVRQIKDAKIKAGTKRLKVKVPKKASKEALEKARALDQAQIRALLMHVMGYGEPGLHTRALACAAGDIPVAEFLVDFKAYVEDGGGHYRIPDNGIPGV